MSKSKLADAGFQAINPGDPTNGHRADGAQIGAQKGVLGGANGVQKGGPKGGSNSCSRTRIFTTFSTKRPPLVLKHFLVLTGVL